MDTGHWGGENKAYLHDKGLSAFPEEQEYLLGVTYWEVTDIKPKVSKKLGPVTFEVTEIKLKQP